MNPGFLLKELKDYSSISEADALSRRYFVMNAFDGTLAILGIIIGTYLAIGINQRVIIGSSIGACIAMGISGFTGTFLTETAERKRSMMKMENLMLKKMSGTVIEKAMNFASVYTAFINGIAPVIVVLACLTPFILLGNGLIQPPQALHLSLSIAFTILLTLGIYLGEISKENKWISGARMLIIGFLVVVVTLGANLLLGLK